MDEHFNNRFEDFDKDFDKFFNQTKRAFNTILVLFFAFALVALALGGVLIWGLIKLINKWG